MRWIIGTDFELFVAVEPRFASASALVFSDLGFLRGRARRLRLRIRLRCSLHEIHSGPTAPVCPLVGIRVPILVHFPADDLSVSAISSCLACTFSQGVKSEIKSASTCDFIADLGWKLMSYLLSSTAHFVSRPESSGL